MTILANNNQVSKKDRKSDGKVYKNPLKTHWGKIIIVAISLSMVLAIIITLIYEIVKMSGNV